MRACFKVCRALGWAVDDTIESEPWTFLLTFGIAIILSCYLLGQATPTHLARSLTLVFVWGSAWFAIRTKTHPFALLAGFVIGQALVTVPAWTVTTVASVAWLAYVMRKQ